jgi:hypothetical protein
VENDARGLDPAAEQGGAADHAARPDNLGDPFGGVDPVLDRQNHRLWTDHRAHLLGRTLQVVELDAEHNQVDWSNVGRIVGRHSLDRELVHARRLEGQAASLDRFQVGSPGDERYVFAGPREQPADRSAKTAGSHHSDSHGPPPTACLSAQRRADRKTGLALHGLSRFRSSLHPTIQRSSSSYVGFPGLA